MKKKDLKERIRLIQTHYNEILKQRDILLTFMGHIMSFYSATKEEPIEVRDFLFRTNMELITNFTIKFLSDKCQQIPIDENNTKQYMEEWIEIIRNKNPEFIEKLETIKKPEDTKFNHYG